MAGAAAKKKNNNNNATRLVDTRALFYQSITQRFKQSDTIKPHINLSNKSLANVVLNTISQTNINITIGCSYFITKRKHSSTTHTHTHTYIYIYIYIGMSRQDKRK